MPLATVQKFSRPISASLLNRWYPVETFDLVWLVFLVHSLVAISCFGLRINYAEYM